MASNPTTPDAYTIPDHSDILLHPRGSYVVAQYTDPTLDIGKESAFKIERVLKEITKSNSLRTFPRPKHLLIKTINPEQTTALLAANTFANHDTSFTLHRTFNTAQCTILANTHRTTSLSTLGDELASQGVISIRRYTTKRNHTLLHLTFNTIEQPEHVHLEHVRYTTRLHVPLPLRCKKCQRYAHGERACTAPDVRCARCSEGHPSEGCSRPPRCAACGGPHPVTDPKCPKWLFEREVCRLAAHVNIPHTEARTLTQKSPPVHLSPAHKQPHEGRRSYASAASPSSPRARPPQSLNLPRPELTLHSQRRGLLPDPPLPPGWVPTRKALLPTPPFPPTRRPPRGWGVPVPWLGPLFQQRDFPPLPDSHPPPRRHLLTSTKSTATSTRPPPIPHTVSTSTDPEPPPVTHSVSTSTDPQPPPVTFSVSTSTDPKPLSHSVSTSTDPQPPSRSIHTQTDRIPHHPNPTPRASPKTPSSTSSSQSPTSLAPKSSSPSMLPRPVRRTTPPKTTLPKNLTPTAPPLPLQTTKPSRPSSPSPLRTRGMRKRQHSANPSLADQREPTPITYVQHETSQPPRAAPE